MPPRYLALPAIALTVAFAVGEVAVRVVGTTDDHGQFSVRGHPIPPYGVRTGALLASVARFADSDQSARAGYHPELGWAPRAGHRGGLYAYNRDGIRADVEYDRTPQPGVLRIATFGDSFTHGDEVRNSETWPHALEMALLSRGVRAEVLNFAMSGFGMDQALLRWQIEGRRFEPDIVVFGLNPENMARNINVFRPALYPATELPLTKPRFVLAGGRLKLVNSPTVALAELPALVRDFRSHPLRRHEGHAFRLADERWWHRSRLASLVEARVAGPAKRRRVQSEQFRVTAALLRRFGSAIERAGSRFVVVRILPRSHLAQFQRGRRPYYRPLLDALARKHPSIETAPVFEDAAQDHWAPKGHFSAAANRRVGELVAERLVECIATGRCRPHRKNWGQAPF